MAVTVSLYNTAAKHFGNGNIDWDADTIKMALVTDAYTFDAAHEYFDTGTDNAADPSFNEVADGTGYTLANHGASLASKTVGTVGAITSFDAADLTYSALTKSFKYGIIYKSNADLTLAELIACVTYDAANISIAGIDFVTIWNSAGIFKITRV